MVQNTAATSQTTKKRLFDRFLDMTEVLGNKLPDPTVLFMILCLIVLVFSWIGAGLGWSVIHPGTGKAVTVYNLVSKDGLTYMFQNFVGNVTSFAPLGVTLVIMTGMGLLTESGLFKSAFLSFGLSVNKRILTTAIVFLGIMANFMSDVGFIVLPPLAAMLFAAEGRHPLVGMCCAYAACGSGMAANLLVGVGDATTTAITISAAKILNPNFTLSPACNWYFFAIAVFVLTPVAVLVTERILEPRMGTWKPNANAPMIDLESYRLSDIEKKAMKKTGILILIILALFALGTFPTWGILRDEKGVSLFVSSTNQLSSILVALTILLGAPGLYYGKLTGTIKDSKQFAKACTKGISTVAPFVVLCVVAAQFISYFGKTNLGVILSVNGAKLISNSGIPPLLLFILCIILFCLLDLFVASSSAKWTLLAPIFVPMFMLLNYNPAIIQAAYRVGDSIANSVTPLMAYFALLVGIAQEYDEKAGIGTMLSMLIPYSLFYGITWIIYFSIYFLTGLPFGM